MDEARLTVITRAYVVQSPLTKSPARPHRMQIAPRVPANQDAAAQESAADLGNLARGFAWALTLEGAAVLAIYSVWQLGHLLALHF